MNTRLESLQAIEAELWRELQAAPRDKQHPWRTPVLATTDGQIGDARTVILREVNAEQSTLLIYTDARAGSEARSGAQQRVTECRSRRVLC